MSGNKMAGYTIDGKINVASETGLISERAEIFRSKLIGDFHLVETIDEQGHIETPKYYSKEVTEPDVLKKMLTEGPHALVRFQVYSKLDKAQITWVERRKNRVKNKNSNMPPIDMWANWVLASTWFQNAMLIIILSNSVVLGIQAELNDKPDPGLAPFKTVLDVFDFFSLFIFVLEIVLKWIDNFKLFWKNGWNIFDFFVTFLSFVPEIIKFSDIEGTAASDLDITVIADNLRGFRILRSLKMVTRFRQVRLIALAVAKAFQAMVFITILLFTFLYIFAIAGVIFFDSYSQSQRSDLEFKYSFSSLLQAWATLFQLLTLDRWHDILLDVIKVANPLGAGFYIILWICTGSFVFRNIFVGIMVNNFQTIRADLFQEVMEIQEIKQQTLKIEKLNEELMKQDAIFQRGKTEEGQTKDEDEEDEEEIQTTWTQDETGSGINLAVNHQMGKRASIFSAINLLSTGEKVSVQRGMSLRVLDTTAGQSALSQYQKDVSHHLLHATQSCSDWQKTVSENLDTIAKNPIETAWPKDTLFRYLLLMEALQENLKERNDLLMIADQALLQVFDT